MSRLLQKQTAGNTVIPIPLVIISRGVGNVIVRLDLRKLSKLSCIDKSHFLKRLIRLGKLFVKVAQPIKRGTDKYISYKVGHQVDNRYIRVKKEYKADTKR